MNLLQRIATYGTLMALSACAPVSPYKPLNQYLNERNQAVKVDEGEIGYAKGPIISYGFHSCVAVIFDREDEALFAHAFPSGPEYDYDGERDDYAITVNNVVTYLIRDAQSRWGSTDDVEATVIFNKEYIEEKVLRNIEEEGIKISRIIIREPKPRSGESVFYDPKSNLLSIIDEHSAR